MTTLTPLSSGFTVTVENFGAILCVWLVSFPFWKFGLIFWGLMLWNVAVLGVGLFHSLPHILRGSFSLGTHILNSKNLSSVVSLIISSPLCALFSFLRAPVSEMLNFLNWSSSFEFFFPFFFRSAYLGHFFNVFFEFFYLIFKFVIVFSILHVAELCLFLYFSCRYIIHGSNIFSHPSEEFNDCFSKFPSTSCIALIPLFLLFWASVSRTVYHIKYQKVMFGAF